MQPSNSTIPIETVSLLIVDDSLVFRRFLGDVFEDCEDISIVGEAENGIEALDMVLKTNPDVILLDMEMPLMDGMTALQHLMIRFPTPTIMFSSLTEEGTARCFDTMKNGAVDFVCKDFIFQENSPKSHEQLIVEKVKKAARVKLKSREPFYSGFSLPTDKTEVEQRVVFCEECGNREVAPIVQSQPLCTVTCSQCGDLIEVSLSAHSQYRRNTFITVLGGGDGSFFNLLEIIPQLEPQMGGALIAVIHQSEEHVNRFAANLDAISPTKIARATEGDHAAGGNCYIISGKDYMSIKPYSTQLTLQKVQKKELKGGPLDILLASVSTVYKNRAAGIILSGEENDGDQGVSILVKNGGTQGILDPRECYSKSMGSNIVQKCNLDTTYPTSGIVEMIKKLHLQAKYDGVAG